MHVRNASHFAFLTVFALALFPSQAAAQRKSHERAIEKKEPEAKETPRAPEPRQQPQPSRPQAPPRQEPAPGRPSMPTPRVAPAPLPAVPTPAPRQRFHSAQPDPQPPRVATPSALASPVRQVVQEIRPRVRIEESKPVRENPSAGATPPHQEEPAKERTVEPRSDSDPLPAPKTKRALPTLRWKENPTALVKPAPITQRVAPKTLSPYFGQRFLPQLPKPVVRASSATGSVEKSHFPCKKKAWSGCEPAFEYCSPCVCFPPLYWIPVTIFSFVEIPCYQPQIVEIQEVEVAAGEPILLDLDAVEKAVRLGDLYFRAGKFDKAAASYMEAVTLAPEQAELYFLLSDALFAIGDFHFASYCIRTALELDSTLARSEADKREFYGNRDDFYRHLRVLERYLEEYPEDADAQLVLAYNRRFSQDPSGAQRALRRALEIQDDPAGRVLLEAMTKR